MAYCLLEVRAVAGPDSNLQTKYFDATGTMWQVNDLETVTPQVRVGPSDTQAAIGLGSITQGYRVFLFSDYPVLVRFNGSTATQFQLTPNAVPAQSVGAPLPAQCFIGGTFQVSSIYVTPISGASQTANVWLFVSGDPQTAYV